MRSLGNDAALAVPIIPTVPYAALFHSVFLLPSSGMKQVGQAMLLFQGESKLAADTFFLSLEVSFGC